MSDRPVVTLDAVSHWSCEWCDDSGDGFEMHDWPDPPRCERCGCVVQVYVLAELAAVGSDTDEKTP